MVKKKVIKKKSHQKMSKQDKQTLWVVVSILVLIGVFVGGYLYFQSLNSFEYLGIQWDIQKYPGLTLYHSRFPIIYMGELVANYNIFLRNDPRKNEIPLKTEFQFDNQVVISFQPESIECDDTTRVSTDLVGILNAFPFITNVSGGVSNESVADELGLDFVDCSTKDKTVILIQRSDSAEIIQDNENPNCYIINIGECEETLAVERFMLGIIKQLNFTKI